MSAWRCEVKTARRGWVLLDEGWTRSKAVYERQVRAAYPILRTREYRIVRSDTPEPRILFSLVISLETTTEPDPTRQRR